MIPLPPKKRSELRSQAHKLTPVVIIGDKGLTDEVVAEIDRSLKAHELIKVRAATDERDARDVWLETICERLQAHPVQQIGKVFVLYRENPKEKVERRKPAAGAAAPGGTKKAGARGDERKAGKFVPRVGKLGARGDERKSGAARKPSGFRSFDRKPPDARGEQRKGGAARGEEASDAAATGTSRRRSRTPSPLPESGPRRRRPPTSR